MAPNKTDLILKRMFPELTQLSLPAMSPPAIDDSNNGFTDIFIDPAAFPRPTLLADITGSDSFRFPIFQGDTPSIDENPATWYGPFISAGTYYERWRVPTSPASIEESGGVFVELHLWDGWKLQVRGEMHSYPDSNNF